MTQNDMRQIEDLVRRMMRAAFGEFMTQSRISHVDESSDPCADTVVFDPESGQGEPVARLEGWGDISVPPKDSETVLLHNGFQGFEIPLSMKRWRPDGASSKAGTRGLYSDGENRLILHGKGSATPGQVEVVTKSGATIIIDKDGNIDATSAGNAKAHLDKAGSVAVSAAAGQKVTIDAGAGADVQVNGGTAKVSRVDDSVDCGTILVQLVANGVFAGSYTPPGGAAIPFSMPNATIDVRGKITSGADRFKG